MITLNEIESGDTVKVLLCDDGVEEETLAKVVDVFDTCLTVRYYTATSKIYKSACLYELDDDDSPVDVESLIEHYPGGVTPLTFIRKLAYLEDEIDPDENSDIEDMSDDDESDLDGFIVPDSVLELPDDHVEVDRVWNQWTPPTSGGRRFKALIDAMDEVAKIHMDNQQFS